MMAVEWIFVLLFGENPQAVAYSATVFISKQTTVPVAIKVETPNYNGQSKH